MDANYVVMAVTLIIWAGLFGYLISLDRKVNRLEKRNEN
jgi:CcmD family protein